MAKDKKITTFYLDSALVKDFDKFCEEEDKNRSKVANRLLKEFVETKKKMK